ncbi:hypothetical protein [Entomohabitans teleogrylli]|uniref:hypothetical protein n=1 Tax=Entomohabitans teleogrylli TaxID=1384589 RepID=UPI00073D525C|nr:hypothetical protein [Entomohabitans teleogrylli]
MRAYYLAGNNIDWLIGICLLFFATGTVIALAMVAIPQKFNLRVNRGNTFIYSGFVAIAGFCGMLVLSIHSFTMEELEAGRHWNNDCKLLEANIPTGTFTDSVNKLDCAGIIINVPVSQYYAYISQWELYQANKK